MPDGETPEALVMGALRKAAEGLGYVTGVRIDADGGRIYSLTPKNGTRGQDFDDIGLLADELAILGKDVRWDSGQVFMVDYTVDPETISRYDVSKDNYASVVQLPTWWGQVVEAEVEEE